LGLGTEGYSVALLTKIEYAGANLGSFEQAAESLGRLAELPISAKHVQRLTERLGRERAAARDAEVARLQAGRLSPRRPEPPAVAAVHLDAGKVQLRADDVGRGVHGPHWSDSKVGCFLTYTARTGQGDPQPQPPAVFLDGPGVARLCREMERVRSGVTPPATAWAEAAGQADTPLAEADVERPRRLVRTAVATMQDAEAFGWLVAAEAQRRGFYEARRRALVGDGGNWIEPLGQMHFPGWVQVLDFLHLLVHLYAAAQAAHRGRPGRAWRLYERLLHAAWAGRRAEVQRLLREQAQRLGPPAAQATAETPSKVLALTVAYVESNLERMDYPRYRREGLPVTSAAVESLVKQMNQRVKGTEKFWLEGGVEAVLQVRAAYLSDDGRGDDFHRHRPRGRAVGQHRLRPAA